MNGMSAIRGLMAMRGAWSADAVEKQPQILRLRPAARGSAQDDMQRGEAGSSRMAGAKALSFFASGAARLKSCPVTKRVVDTGRSKSWGTITKCIVQGVLLVACVVAMQAQEPPVPAQMETLDRVVAVVNNQPILWSDIRNEIRFAVLDPDQVNGTLTPQKALQELISRALIQQQIGQEDATAAEPSDKDVQARVKEIRKELPACVRMNCATDAGWQAFLRENELTADQIETYLRLRLEILRFIEIRFRQGIQISPEETEAYYRDKLVPQYAKGAKVPALSEVAPRIEEILLEQQVNVMFDSWLDNLRKQGNVEVLDASLESGVPASSTEGDRVE